MARVSPLIVCAIPGAEAWWYVERPSTSRFFVTNPSTAAVLGTQSLPARLQAEDRRVPDARAVPPAGESFARVETPCTYPWTIRRTPKSGPLRPRAKQLPARAAQGPGPPKWASSASCGTTRTASGARRSLRPLPPRASVALTGSRESGCETTCRTARSRLSEEKY